MSDMGGNSLTAADVIRQALARLRLIDGLVTASLVEPDSAYVLDTVAGDVADDTGTDPVLSTTVAAGASDVVQVIGLMAAGLGEPDELEDVIITLGRHHHLITLMPAAGASGLLVVVTLDRARTNLALARRQLRDLGPLLAPTIEPSRAS
jgi:hypothetical protein